MLIYATSIRFPKTTDADSILLDACNWIAGKTSDRLSPGQIKGGINKMLDDGQKIESAAFLSNFPQLLAFRYSHNDSTLGNRRKWITEVGIRVDSDKGITMSIVLKTEETSARIGPIIRVTRPAFISSILQKHQVDPTTPGLRLMKLDEASASSFRIVAEQEERELPIVVVSPNSDGSYPLDLDYLRTQIVTLSDVV